MDELFLITDLLLLTSQFLVVAEVRPTLTFWSDSDCWYSLSVPEEHKSCSRSREELLGQLRGRRDCHRRCRPWASEWNRVKWHSLQYKHCRWHPILMWRHRGVDVKIEETFRMKTRRIVTPTDRTSHEVNYNCRNDRSEKVLEYHIKVFPPPQVLIICIRHGIKHWMTKCPWLSRDISSLGRASWYAFLRRLQT